LDYASAAEVFAAIDALDAEVAARLQAVARAQPAAAAFARSADRDRRRRFDERQRLARRLGAAPASVAASAPSVAGLRELRDAQQNLVHAHAEGLPALRDRGAVDVLARHMVDVAAQLTVIDLWIEAEDA
jgi:hypothetical protein